MIVQRDTYKVKMGKGKELVALTKGECERLGMSCRVLSSLIGGTVNRVIVEFEFEDEAAREQFWKEWNARPETSAFMEKFHQLIENDIGRELLLIR